MKQLFVILAVALFSFTTVAQEQFGWKGDDGRFITDSQSMRSVNNFGGSLILTSDADWFDTTRDCSFI